MNTCGELLKALCKGCRHVGVFVYVFCPQQHLQRSGGVTCTSSHSQQQRWMHRFLGALRIALATAHDALRTAAVGDRCLCSSYCEMTLSLRRNRPPQDPEELVTALDALFGRLQGKRVCMSAFARDTPQGRCVFCCWDRGRRALPYRRTVRRLFRASH